MALDTTKTAHELINSGRSTGQTVLDSDGNLKWAMENLYRNGAGGAQSITVVSGVDYTIRAASGSVAYSGAATGTLDASSGVSRVEVTASTTTLTITPTSATDIAVYRSDLAGMQFDKYGSDYLPNETGGALFGLGIDYSTGRGGVQVYEGRTNLNTHFEVSEAEWASFAGAVLEDQALSALGTFRGCKVTRSATAGYATVNLTFSVTSGDDYVVTALWSDPTGDGLVVRLDNFSVNSTVCNLTPAGVFNASFTDAGAATLLDHRDLGGGLYRSSIKWTPNFTGDANFALGPSGADGDSVILYVGDIQPGSSASPLIPTYGSTVTRGADDLKTLVSSFGYNVNAGTLVVDFVSFDSDITDTQNIAGFSDGSSQNRALIRREGVTSRALIVSGGSTQANFSVDGIATGETSKVALGFEPNNFAQSLDGTAVVNDADGIMPSGITELKYGRADFEPTSSILNGLIHSIAYYPFAASDAQLVEASS